MVGGGCGAAAAISARPTWLGPCLGLGLRLGSGLGLGSGLTFGLGLESGLGFEGVPPTRAVLDLERAW